MSLFQRCGPQPLLNQFFDQAQTLGQAAPANPIE